MNVDTHDTCDLIEARTSLLRDLGRAGVWVPVLERAIRERNRELYLFQQAGAELLRAMLERWGGALLADAPGLGKTRTSLSAADLIGARVLAVVPASLRAQWQHERPDLMVVSHSALAGDVESIEAAADAANVDLVIVDEAHGFRNPETRRYQGLARLARGRRLLFVSATLIHNGLSDLCALLRLFLSDSDLISLTGGYTWSGIEAGDLVAMQVVLDSVCVRRSRRVARLVESRLSAHNERRLELPGGRTAADFVPQATEITTELVATITRLAHALALANEPAALLESVLLRRATSSLCALSQSLRRLENYLSRRREALLSGADITRDEFRRAFGADEATQLSQGVLSFWYNGEASATLDDIDGAMAAISRLVVLYPAVTALDEQRVAQLVRVAAAATRTIVFTEYRSTAAWLARALPRTFGIGTLTGTMSSADIYATVQRFSRGEYPFHRQSSLLLATPVGMEGLNLQAADHVVHFDLPWTAARLEQRTGRADRIGRVETVQVTTFAPPPPFENRLRILPLLAHKASLHGELVGRLDGQLVESSLEYASRLAIIGATSGPRRDRSTRYYGILGEHPAILIKEPRSTSAYRLDQGSWRRLSPSVLLRELANLIDAGAPVWSADDQDFHVDDLLYAADLHTRHRIARVRALLPLFSPRLSPFVAAARKTADLALKAGDKPTAVWLLETVVPTLTRQFSIPQADWRARVLARWEQPPRTPHDWALLQSQLDPCTPRVSPPTLGDTADTTFVAIIYTEIPSYRRDSFTPPDVSRGTSRGGYPGW
jgi:superfamily II DNA or RNA helicase